MRLFFALWPGDALREEIARAAGQWTWPQRAARVAPEKLHATLHFLGHVDAARVPALAGALRVPFEPFEATFDAHRVWPGGIAVIECTRPPAPLVRLHAAMGQALHAEGFAIEGRRYRPHITLARKAFDATPPKVHPPVLWCASEGYVLVESINGVGYRVMARSA